MTITKHITTETSSYNIKNPFTVFVAASVAVAIVGFCFRVGWLLADALFSL